MPFSRTTTEAVGPSPEILQTKAELLERLGRSEEGVAEWKRLLRIDPSHSYALTEIVSLLPLEDEAELGAMLEQQNDPVASATEIARNLAYANYDRVSQLERYVNRKAPDSAAAHFVTGLQALLEGRYGEAAELYRKAYESEMDADKRKAYVNDYLEAMAYAGAPGVELW